MKRGYRIILILLFAGYIFALVKITLFRTSVRLLDTTFSADNRYITSLDTAVDRANFIPFHSIYYYLISKQEPIEVGLVNVLGNILLFIPLGFFVPLLWQKFRTMQSMLLTIFITSFVFECIQLLVAIGSFDVDDILLNTTGGVLGYSLFLLLRQLTRTTTDNGLLNKQK